MRTEPGPRSAPGAGSAMRRNADLLVAAALAVLAALFALVAGIPTPLRIVVAVPVVLAAPGYTLTEALLPRRDRGAVERVLLAMALSISVSVLGGLLLTLLPAGLTRTTQTLLLSVVTIAGAAAAAVRRGAAGAAGAAGAEASAETAAPARGLSAAGIGSRGLSAAGIGSLVLALVLAAVAITVGVRTAQAHGAAAFTQLWISENSAGTHARVGATNDEGAAQSYTLALATRDGQRRTYRFALPDGATWQTEIALPAAAGGYPVTVRLYRAQAPGVVYREVSLGASPS